MERRHTLSLALMSIVTFYIGNAVEPHQTCVVVIDPSAAARFGGGEASMEYTYSVIPTVGGLSCAAEGHGTFNFKNAVEHRCASLSAFSHPNGKKMDDINIHSSMIKVGTKAYMPVQKPIQIKASGYPYAIIYDIPQDQFHIVNKHKASIARFICHQEEVS